MIALICLLAVLSLGDCLEELPTRRAIETSINRTIDEVERLLRSDPNLPRLSRSEIVDILFNITSNDMKSLEHSVEKTRENYQRALMVVLPFDSKDSHEHSLKDLYTKVPLVKLLQDTLESTNVTQNETPRTIKISDNLINTKTKISEDDESNNYKNHRDTYTKVAVSPTEETLRLLLNSDTNEESAPQKFSFNLENLETARDEESRQPFIRNFQTDRSPTTKKLEIVYSTSVTERPTTKALKTTMNSFEGFEPTIPPIGSTQNVLTSDQWHYYEPPSTSIPKSRRPSEDIRERKKSTAVPFLPTMMMIENPEEQKDSTSLPTLKPKVSSGRVIQRQKDRGSPWDMENLRIVNEMEKPLPFYVTPMSSTTPAKLQDSITTVSNPSSMKTPMPMREEIHDLLESIGLHPKVDKNNDKTKNNVNDDHAKIFGTNFQIPDSSNIILGQASGLTALEVEQPSIRSQNTFERTPQEVKKGVDNLSPDVQLLFQRFGIQSSAKDHENLATRVTTEKPRTYTSETSFWNNFKPLPASEVRDEGMKDFLAKFGLGINENRNEKSMKIRKETENRRPSLIEAVPGNMKRILENIGLITRSQRPVESAKIETTEAPQFHVFKPHETLIDDEKQRAKINKLLDTVKLVQEGKADVMAVQNAAKELLETTKSLKNGPDPLSLEEILKIYNDDVKNEIKRQQDPAEIMEMATSETSESSSTTSSPKQEVPTFESPANSSDSSGASSDSSGASSEASSDSSAIPADTKDAEDVGIDASTTQNSNLEALADSFGGTTAAPDPVLPTPRKTGLYFLVDWNTFLEVGEEGKDKVNLRFQPKAGDRTRFLPITVP